MADTKLSALTELAAEPASNDEVYIRDVSEAATNESKRITIAQLMKAAPAGGNGGAQELIVDAHNGIAITHGLRGYYLASVGESAYFMVMVPDTVSSITSVEIIFQPALTLANMHFRIRTYFGQYDGGEAWNVHSEDEAGRNIGATVNGRNLAHDITDLCTGLAAGDFLHVNVGYDATANESAAYPQALRLKWT